MRPMRALVPFPELFAPDASTARMMANHIGAQPWCRKLGAISLEGLCR